MVKGFSMVVGGEEFEGGEEWREDAGLDGREDRGDGAAGGGESGLGEEEGKFCGVGFGEGGGVVEEGEGEDICWQGWRG